jgi:FixJ family two-component response regulator
MASAVTTRIFEKNPLNIASIFGPRLDSGRSEGIPIIFLITTDISEQESLKSLVAREGWRLETFKTAREFLAWPRTLVPSCIILALSQEVNGLEEQREIVRDRFGVPIIVVSRNPDVPTTVQAMKAGAIDFFVRPFSDETLLLGLRAALERSRVALQHEMELSDLRNCYASLTSREREVMVLVVSGLLNKQTGAELGITETTVKAHRGQVMRKMKANSLPDLVRMASVLPRTTVVRQRAGHCGRVIADPGRAGVDSNGHERATNPSSFGAAFVGFCRP